MSGGTRRSEANYGIQANTVQADAIAIGQHARATSHRSVADEAALRAAVAELRAAVSGLGLHPSGRQAIEGDIDALEREGAAPKPDRQRTGGLLQSIVGKLQMVGEALHDATGITEALSKLGELLHVPLGF